MVQVISKGAGELAAEMGEAEHLLQVFQADQEANLHDQCLEGFHRQVRKVTKNKGFPF